MTNEILTTLKKLLEIYQFPPDLIKEIIKRAETLSIQKINLLISRIAKLQSKITDFRETNPSSLDIALLNILKNHDFDKPPTFITVLKNIISSDLILPEVYYQQQSIDAIPVYYPTKNQYNRVLVQRKDIIYRYVPGAYISYGDELIKVNAGKVLYSSGLNYFDLTYNKEKSIKFRLHRQQNELLLEPTQISLKKIEKDYTRLDGKSNSKNPRICTRCFNVYDGYELTETNQKYTGERVFICSQCTTSSNFNPELADFAYLYETTGSPNTYPHVEVRLHLNPENTCTHNYNMPIFLENVGLEAIELFEGVQVESIIDYVYRTANLEKTFPNYIVIDGKNIPLYRGYLWGKKRLSMINPIFFKVKDPADNTYKTAKLMYKIQSTDAIRVKTNILPLLSHLKLPSSMYLYILNQYIKDKLFKIKNIPPYYVEPLLNLTTCYALFDGIIYKDLEYPLDYLNGVFRKLFNELKKLNDIIKEKNITEQELIKILQDKAYALFKNFKEEYKLDNTKISPSKLLEVIKEDRIKIVYKKTTFYLKTKFLLALITSDALRSKYRNLSFLERKDSLSYVQLLDTYVKAPLTSVALNSFLNKVLLHTISHILYDSACELTSTSYFDFVSYEDDKYIWLSEQVSNGLGYSETIMNHLKTKLFSNNRAVSGMLSKIIESFLSCPNYIANKLLFDYSMKLQLDDLIYSSPKEQQILLDKLMFFILNKKVSTNHAKSLMDVIYDYITILVKNKITAIYWVLKNVFKLQYVDLSLSKWGSGYFLFLISTLCSRDTINTINSILFQKSNFEINDIEDLSESIESLVAHLETCVTKCGDCIEFPTQACTHGVLQDVYLNRYLLQQLFLKQNKTYFARISNSSNIRDIIKAIVQNNAGLIYAPFSEYIVELSTIFGQIRSLLRQKFNDKTSTVLEELNNPIFFVRENTLCIGFLFLPFVRMDDYDNNI